jgi:hypothetical protein
LRAPLARLALLLLCGCAAFKPRPADPGLGLLPPADAGFSADLTQAITLTKGGQAVEVMAVVEISPQAVKLAVLSPLGNRVLSLDWDGKTLKQERDPSLPKEFPAELILRDLQLALWAEEPLRRHLPRRWSLRAMPGRREFFKDGQSVISISTTDGVTEFDHAALGYHLHIQPVKNDD